MVPSREHLRDTNTRLIAAIKRERRLSEGSEHHRTHIFSAARRACNAQQCPACDQLPLQGRPSAQGPGEFAMQGVRTMEYGSPRRLVRSSRGVASRQVEGTVNLCHLPAAAYHPSGQPAGARVATRACPR